MLLLRSEGQHARRLRRNTRMHAHLARRCHGRQRLAREAQLAALGPLHAGGGGGGKAAHAAGRKHAMHWPGAARSRSQA